MGKLAALLTVVACGLTVNASAQNLLAYWNMDSVSVSGKLEADNGSQQGNVSMAAKPEGIFINYLTTGTGTEINIYPSSTITPGNQALIVSSVADIGQAAYLEISGLNFTNQTDGVISFAIKSEDGLIWNQHIDLGYKVGAGTWQDWDTTGTIQKTDWELTTFDIPDAVNGQSDVSVRIEIIDWLAFVHELGIDNIQITAVPEPGTWALMAGVGAAGLLLLRRRKRG